jgi:hypothetical protein
MVNDFGCSAMAFSPGGTLFAGGEDSTGVVSLFKVNTVTGVATRVGESNQGKCSSGNFMSDMSFGPGGKLYALFVQPGMPLAGNPCLGSLNLKTGMETDVGLTGMFKAGDALAFGAAHPRFGTLYGADAVNLYAIDQWTGVAHVVHQLSGGVTGGMACSVTGGHGLPIIEPMDAMKFNDDGTMYASLNCVGANYLVTIGTHGADAGEITVIGQTTYMGANVAADGIAFAPTNVVG